jgi:hypothetical protein
MYHQRSISLQVSVPAVGEEPHYMEFVLQTDKDATVMSVLIAKGKRSLIFP